LVRDNSETFTAAEATVKKRRNQLYTRNQISDICLEQIGFWYAGRNQLPVIQETSYQISVGAEEKKQITDLQEPVIRSLLEEENESRITQKCKSTSRSLGSTV